MDSNVNAPTARPEIIPFEPGHLLAIDWREHSRSDRLEHIRNGMQLMERYPYIAFTGAAGERLLGAAGVVLCGFGVGYAWVVVGPEIERYKFWFHRTVGIYLRAILKTFEITRLQAEALKSSRRNREWLEALGFRARPYVIYEMEVHG